MDKQYNLRTKPLEEIALEDFDPSLGEGLVNFWIPRKRDIEFLSRLLKEISGKESPLLVDVGCGSGLISRLFADFGIQVIGIDHDPTLVQRASSTYQHPNLQYTEGKAEDVKSLIKQRGFKRADAVYCSFMPEDVNWTTFMRQLNPDMILHVLEACEERLVTGNEDAYRQPDGFARVLLGPLISYRDLDLRRRFGYFSEDTMMFLDIKEGLIQKYQKTRHEFNRDASQPKQMYKWEAPLESLEMVARTPSGTLPVH